MTLPDGVPAQVNVVQNIDSVQLVILPPPIDRGSLRERLWSGVMMAGCVVIMVLPVTVLIAALEVSRIDPGGDPVLGILGVGLFGVAGLVGLYTMGQVDAAARRRGVMPPDQTVVLTLSLHAVEVGGRRIAHADVERVERGPVLVLRTGEQVDVYTPLRFEDRVWLAEVLTQRLSAGAPSDVPAALHSLRGEREPG